MDVFSLLTMLGGLALFLYGMHVMGDGLSKASGGRMERVLEKMTNSIIKAVLLGAGVTAVIQSSSATTVMVVGFVNSGIMKLSQAVGVIMGANIGTTVTSWILSLAGIEGNNIFLRLLKPSSFAPVMAVIGVIFIMFSKNEKKKNIGTVLIGFAVLMVGMETMSDAVKPLADMPEFANILLKFKNPVLGMMAGLVLTAVVQSSSASIGILQTLCMTGAVSYGAAIPIIMGQNIGTCVTALLSGIGASKNARRTSFVHLYFNLIGTLIFMIVFYSLNAGLHFAFIDDMANPAGIAVIHSIFNVAATLILLPFHKVLEKLAILTVKDGPEDMIKQNQEEQALQLLDDRFLEKPGFAMENCYEVTVEMGALARRAIDEAIELLFEYDEMKAEDVRELETAVDHYEDHLGTYLMRLSKKTLSQKDSQMLSTLLHCIGDLERISDHAVNIVERAEEIHQKQIVFSESGIEELKVYSKAVCRILELATDAFRENDESLARKVEPLEEVIDNLDDETKSRHIVRLRNGECSMEMGFILSDISVNFERVADHCSNIAVCLLRTHANAFDVHEYLDDLKEHKDENFKKAYLQAKAEYALPQN